MSYDLPIGFFAELGPGETGKLVSQTVPPIGFIGYEFTVKPGDPKTFGIEQITTGGVDQFLTAGAVPASVFFPGQEGVELKMSPTTEDAPSPEITVTNYSNQPETFSAVLIGRCPPLQIEVNRSLLGLPSPDVEGRSTCVISVQPQMVCRIRSMLVDYITADSFDLCSVCVGKIEVSNLAGASVPLSMMGVEVKGWPRAQEIFGEQEDGPDLWDGPWLTVMVGQTVSLAVENTTGKRVRFRGVLRVELLPPTPEELRLAGIR